MFKKSRPHLHGFLVPARVIWRCAYVQPWPHHGKPYTRPRVNRDAFEQTARWTQRSLLRLVSATVNLVNMPRIHQKKFEASLSLTHLSFYRYSLFSKPPQSIIRLLPNLWFAWVGSKCDNYLSISLKDWTWWFAVVVKQISKQVLLVVHHCRCEEDLRLTLPLGKAWNTHVISQTFLQMCA